MDEESHTAQDEHGRERDEQQGSPSGFDERIDLREGQSLLPVPDG